MFENTEVSKHMAAVDGNASDMYLPLTLRGHVTWRLQGTVPVVQSLVQFHRMKSHVGLSPRSRRLPMPFDVSIYDINNAKKGDARADCGA